MMTGVVKAWHVHTTQVDWWFCATGKIKMAVYDLRQSSPTYKELNEFTLGDEPNNIIVKIPPGVAHGMKVIEGPCHFVYATSRTYDPKEEGRVLYDDKDIGYDWVAGMPITNKKIT
jgi:dTDP-4-dehydrorhamnose 3,5-epimerase